MPIRSLQGGAVVNLSGKDQALEPADHARLAGAKIVRVDPSNSCNATCVFCDSTFAARAARLPVPVFEEALVALAQSTVLDTLQFGCTYEPTIRKDFSAFGHALERSKLPPPPGTLSIVSNCWLLHKHDITPFVRAGLNKLHVFLHSHRRDEFIAVMGHDYLDQTVTNVRAFKDAHPHVLISAVCVVNRLNVSAPLDFARWAFEEVGVDYLRFTRAQIQGFKPLSPAFDALSKSDGASFEVDDEAWAAFHIALEGVDQYGLDLMDSRQNLKGSAIQTPALRVKRAGAPKELDAMRKARLARLARLAEMA